MGHDPAASIEKWFAEHDGDGEFICHARAVPYAVIGSSRGAGSMIYATKPSAVAMAMNPGSDAAGLSLIGRYGLPKATDLEWIVPLIGARELLFLGDLDPPDLMIFAWLRERLRPKQVRFLGISDLFLDMSGVSSPESFAIPLSDSESNSLSVLFEALPDFREIIGQHCAGMLESEYKIEVEAIMNAAPSPAEVLNSAIAR